MITVSILQDIDQKIQLMNYCEYLEEIKTIDAQGSLDGGVIVLVMGYLIRKDNVKRDFTQTFFFTTQGKVYYVLNDIFRYVEDTDQQEEQDLTNDACSYTTDHDSIPSQEDIVIKKTVAMLQENVADEEKIYDSSESVEILVVEDKYPIEEVIDEVPIDSQVMTALNRNGLLMGAYTVLCLYCPLWSNPPDKLVDIHNALEDACYSNVCSRSFYCCCAICNSFDACSHNS